MLSTVSSSRKLHSRTNTLNLQLEGDNNFLKIVGSLSCMENILQMLSQLSRRHIGLLQENALGGENLVEDVYVVDTRGCGVGEFEPYCIIRV